MLHKFSYNSQKVLLKNHTSEYTCCFASIEKINFCFFRTVFRKDRDDKMSDQNFYLANDNKDCVQVKDNIGLTNLWKNHLCKFPTVTLDTAEAITKEYPTASKLIQVRIFSVY